MNAKANGRARAKGPARKKARPKPEANGAAAPTDEGDRPAPVLSISELPREAVSWLLPGFFPFGMLAMLEGRKDAGKSALACALAAYVTGGPALPGCRPRRARAVLWFAGEEHIPTTTAPKLEAAGVDMRQVLCPGWDRQGKHSDRWVFPGDLDRLAGQLDDSGAALVVIDPLDSYAASGLNLHNPQQCRELLDPLATILAERGVACVCTRNLRKDADGHAQDQGYGSGAIGNIARSVVRLDALAEPPGLRALWRVAGNLSERPDALTLRLVAAAKAVKVEWEGSIKADDPRLADASYDPVEADTLADAKRYVKDRLKGGKVSAKDMIRDGKDLGYSTDKLFRARKAVGAKSVATGGRGKRVWWWVLGV